jgi:DNA polymerase III subunit delta
VPPAGKSDDVFSAIDRGEIAPVYALGGEESFLVSRCLAALRRAVVGEASAGGANLNLDLYDLREHGLGAAINTAKTLPMFAKRRLVIVRDVGELPGEQQAPLLEYLRDPNPSTVLVLVLSGRIDGRLKFIQALRKGGYLHEFAPLRDWQLGDWLMGEARRRRLRLEPEAARALAEAAGPDLGRLALCLEQVALYAGPEAPLTAPDVEAVVPESRARGVFELTKAIGAGQTERALDLLGNLLRNREPPLRIQFMLLRQLRQIWRAKELERAGAPRGEMAARVGLSPHFLDDVLVPARRMSDAALARSFELLYQADRNLKSSRADPEVQVARLVRQLSELAAARSSATSERSRRGSVGR